MATSASRLPELLASGSRQLWIGLATLEVVAFAIDRWRSPGDVVKPMLTRALWLSFTLALVVAWPGNPLTPAAILAGAEHVAGLLNGVPGLDPSTIFDQGVEIFVDHLKTSWDSGYFGLDFNVTDFGGVLVTALIHLLAYALIAIAAFLLLVQGAVVLAFTPLAAALGACRFTIGVTESFAGYLVWWSFKLIAFGILLAIGNDLALVTQGALATVGDDFLRGGVPWEVALLTLAYAVAVLLVPSQLAQKLTQSTPIALRGLLS